MNIHTEVFEKVKKAKARILVVTKYLSPEDTHYFLEKVLPTYKSCIFGIGENRIERITEKNLPREVTHFIGNLQSKKIPEIARLCSTVHSLCSLSHAKILASGDRLPSVFIEVNISGSAKKQGIAPEELGDFLAQLQDLPLKVLGISAMGAGDFTESEKRAEFRRLIALRDEFLPGKSISAGTSRDFEIALEEGIDVVRVGERIFQ